MSSRCLTYATIVQAVDALSGPTRVFDIGGEDLRAPAFLSVAASNLGEDLDAFTREYSQWRGENLGQK